jgi:hypothetical protein
MQFRCQLSQRGLPFTGMGGLFLGDCRARPKNKQRKNHQPNSGPA